MLETATKPPRKLQGLQVLRGVAALLVVWHHLKYNLGVSSTQFSDIPFLATNLGAIGVDIFFVVSGFVIAMTAARLGKDWRAFLANRIARIVPLYFVLSSFVLLRDVVSQQFFHTPSSLALKSVFNSYLYIPLLDTNTYSSPLCGNGWTLSFEMWFYLCLGLFMLRIGGVLAGKIMPVFMVGGGLLTTFFYTSHDWYLPKFLFHPLTLEFCAGCVLYHARQWPGKCTFLWLYLLLPVFLFFASQYEQLGLHMEVLNSTSLGFERAGIWGGFAFCLVGLITQTDLKYPLAWPKLLLLLGDASYSIYLITPLVMTPTAVLVHGFRKLHLITTSLGTEILSGYLYLLGTIWGGVLLWKFFESPATQKAKQIFRRFLPGAEPAKAGI